MTAAMRAPSAVSFRLPTAAACPRVLVVDDQLEMAEMVADGLGERGFEALPVASSRDAAARLETEHVHALVTDLRMPSLDGLALLAISKKTSPLRPVIVMTAYSAVDSAIEAIRLGAYHYLTKPFKLEELAIFLARALEEARIREEALSLRRALSSLLEQGSEAHRPAEQELVLRLLVK